MKHYLAILTSTICLCAPALGQVPAEDGLPAVAPDFRRSDVPDVVNGEPTAMDRDRRPIVPSTPTVLPPELIPRPPLAPVSPEASFNEQSRQSSGGHKPPLSWRARAHKLKLSSTGQQRTIYAKYDAAIVTLIGTLSQFGLRVEMLNSKAGELLALPIDAKSNQRYIFVLCEMPPGTVTIKAAAWSQSKTSTTLIETILLAIEKSTALKGGQQ